MIESLRQNLSLGPFNLPLFIIPLLAAWIIYQVLIPRIFKGREEHIKTCDRIMFNSLFIILIVWKLSPVILQFNTVVQNPIAALYLPGGTAGVLLGIGAAVIYLIVSVSKQKEVSAALYKSIGLNLGILVMLAALLSAGTGLIAGGMNEQSPGSKAIAAGAAAPEFILDAEDGLSYSLADYAGRTVVLNFWASWCPPCRAELPELKSYHSSLESGDPVFLSINLFTSERDPEGLPDFIKEQGLEFPILYDRSGQAAADYGVVSIPTTVIIGPDGLIRAIRSGAVTEAWLRRSAGAQ